MQSTWRLWLEKHYPNKLEDNSTDGRETGTLVIAFLAVKLSRTTSLTQGLPTSYLSLIGGMTGSKLICSTRCIWKVWNRREMAKRTKFREGACHQVGIWAFQLAPFKDQKLSDQSAIVMRAGETKDAPKRKIILCYCISRLRGTDSIKVLPLLTFFAHTFSMRLFFFSSNDQTTSRSIFSHG